MAILAGAALAQRGGADWMTAGNDAQRSSWVRSDPKVSQTSMQKPGFALLWKVKVDNEAKQSFAAPVLLNSYIGYRGFRSLAFVGVSSDKLVGIDTDLGHIEWQKQLPSTGGSSTCAAATAPLTRPTTAAFPAQGGGRGFGGGRGGAARSGVGQPLEGAVTIQQAAAAQAAQAAQAAGGDQAGRGRGGRGGRGAAGPGAPNAPAFGGGGGRGRMPAVVNTVTRDGMLHALYVSNGDTPDAAIRFVPANTRVEGLIVIDNVAYAATGSGCDAPLNSVMALDIASKEVASFKLPAGAVAGSFGPAAGPDGTLYVATTTGDLLALEPKTLKLKDTFRAGQEFTSSPVIFEDGEKAIVAAATKDGRIHLLDAAAMQNPLAQVNAGAAAAALATWQDSGGARWLVGSTGAGISAWKVADQNGSLSLQPGWKLDLASPLPPIVVNGVVFTATTGSNAVLHAIDAATGKDLWNSGKTLTAAVRGGGLSFGNSQLYLGASDGTLYAFGFPMEH